MLTPVVQRWRAQRTSYRPAGEPLDPCRYEVAAIPDDRTARAFVEANHYSASYPAARFRFGLFDPLLVGVAVFSVPMQGKVLDCLPCDHAEAVELGRFVLLDRVPANAESWFLARCFELLRRVGIIGVVSFSDPEPRADAAGCVVFHGHIGTIYQATNATYLGRGRRHTIRLLANGTAVSDRALAKVRQQERGHEAVEMLLVRHGARRRRTSEEPAAWLAEELPRITRTLRHGGNHKYAFGLARGVKRRLPAGLPYPKIDVRAGGSR